LVYAVPATIHIQALMHFGLIFVQSIQIWEMLETKCWCFLHEIVVWHKLSGCFQLWQHCMAGCGTNIGCSSILILWKRCLDRMMDEQVTRYYNIYFESDS